MIKTENYFYASNGSILKDKRELLEFLKEVDEKTYFNHVNLEKNDFANWIRDIFNDKTLAKKMFETKNREETINLIEESLKPKDLSKKDKKSVISRLVEVIKNA